MHCSFLDALRLRMSVPLHWRTALTNDWNPRDRPPRGPEKKFGAREPVDITNFSSKRTYSEIIQSTPTINTALSRWLEEDIPIRISGREEWSEICTRTFSTLRETKIQSFHFKLVNRIMPCRTFLRRLRIYESDECPFCAQTDSLIHFFYSCPNTTIFWMKLQQWLHGIENLYLDKLTPKDILFGVPTGHPKGKIINTILLLAKYFIHRQKLFHEGELCLLQWLKEFRARLRQEKWILTKIGKPEKFGVWGKYLEALG